MKINWIAAKQDYIADVKLSYVDIAKKYGVSVTAVSERAAKDSWTTARKKTLLKLEEKLVDRTAQTMADHQMRLMRQARFVAGKGMQGIVSHKPRSAREAKELWEAGTNMQAKVLGIDKPNVNIQNNTQNNMHIGWDEFVKMMEERK
jgi:uncharacterized protein YjcR